MHASVVHITNPFDPYHGRELVMFEHSGHTVRGYLEGRFGVGFEFDRPTICFLNGEPLLREKWGREIADDDVVAFVTLPQGGGQGGTDPLRVVLMLALVLLAPYAVGALGGAFSTTVMTAAGVEITTLTLTGSALATAGIIGGSMLINALLPLPMPDMPEPPSPSYALGPAQNQARLNQPIPVLYGRHRLVPDYAEPPWQEYGGQVAFHETTGTSGRAPKQFLYQTFCLGQGDMTIEQVRVGEEDADEYADEVEYETYGPGVEIELIPKSVITSSSVFNLGLPGPPEKVGDTEDVLVGQVLPVDQDTAYTATGGGNYTGGSSESNPKVKEGVTYGVLDDSSQSWTVNALVGQQVYIGGAQTQAEDMYNQTDANWNNAATATQSDKLVHPRRLRTIYANDATRIYVRPDWHANYDPATVTSYHIRDDYVGPFETNPTGTLVRYIGIDIAGEPLYLITDGGSYRRFSLGVRFDKRKIDDSGEPIDGTGGEWTTLGDRFTAWQDSEPGRIGGLRKGAIASRRCTIALYGTGFLLNPIAISQRYEVPKARYEVRGRRTTQKNQDKKRYSNTMRWLGLRGYLTDTAHKFDGVTTLATRIKASENLSSSNYQAINCIIKRKLPIYQGTAWGPTGLGSNPLASTDGSATLEVTMVDHGLPTGATVTIAGASDFNGLLASEINASHVITRLVKDANDTDFFTVELTTPATANGQNSSGAGTVTVTNPGGWTATQETANPAWAIADALRDSTYGAGASDSQLDLDGFIAAAATWEDRGDEFNGVFDTKRSLIQQVNTIARAGRARVFAPGGVWTIIRDEPQAIRAAMFSPRNIVKNSLGIDYVFMTAETPDSVEVEYIDRETWKPDKVHAYLAAPETNTKPARMQLFGVTDREHAWREGMYMTAENRYRRRFVSFQTDFEGQLVLPGDKITVSHDMPGWGQAGELTGYDAGTKRLTCSEQPTWQPGDDKVTNSGFETDTAGWSPNGTGTTIVASTDTAQTGKQSMKISTTAGTPDFIRAYTTPPFDDISQDAELTATVWLKAGGTASGRWCEVGLSEVGGAQGTAWVVNQAVQLTNSWQQVTITGTVAESDRTDVRLWVGISSSQSPPNTDIVYADNVHAYNSGDSVLHYVALQKDDGSVDGPFTATEVVGQPRQLQLAGALTWTPETEGGLRERTKYVFGRSTAWNIDARVIAIIPRGSNRVEVRCIGEDDLVHSADEATYIPPTDEETLGTTPEAPVVTNVVVCFRGPRDDQKIHVSWGGGGGAVAYEVEIGMGLGDRRVTALADAINNGPIQDTETLRAYIGGVGTGTDGALPLGSRANEAVVTVQSNAHGLTTGDRIWTRNFPVVFGIPTSETNGPQTVTVIDSNNFEFATTTISNIPSGSQSMAWEGAVWHLETTATGTAVGSYSNPSTYVFYTAGVGDFAWSDIIGGDTSRAWLANKEAGGSMRTDAWDFLGTSQVVFLIAPFISDADDGVDETVWVRVRGVGRLRGPWAYGSATTVSTIEQQTIIFDATTGALTVGSDSVVLDGGSYSG